jgi:chromosome segregation ATPase
VSDDVKPNPEWEASMDQYRKHVEANPSLRRDPILRAHLERIRLTHQKLLDAKARTEPELLSLPAEVLEDIPIWASAADRFADLAAEAQAMVDRWEELAQEYAGLDRRIREFLDEDESRAGRLRTLGE